MKKTDSFIHEIRLKCSPKEINILHKKLDIARQVYNSVLGESLRRLSLMRNSKLYQQARNMSNKTSAENKNRQACFKQARQRYSFNEYALHAYVTKKISGTWLALHLDSLTLQKVATRAYLAVEKYAYNLRGRPRFKGKNQFCSLEGKNNKSGIRFIDGKVIWNTKSSGKLEFGLYYDQQDKYGIEAAALNCRTKYVRLVKRKIKDKTQWYAQLVQEGEPLQKYKNKVSQTIVGLDLGPSSIAVVSKEHASLQAFCAGLKNQQLEIAKLQCKLARSLRATNEDNFAPTGYIIRPNGKKLKKLGKVKKGCKIWYHSNKYNNLHNHVTELHRKMRATRKIMHNKKANEIIELGCIIKTEKISYKGWQKLFGKSINYRAPGLFIQTLKRKAASAGGKVIEFNTRTTCLSQVCHCGNRAKKALQERWHNCKRCGLQAQRDLYSAFLAQYVENDRLDSSNATNAWAGADILLEQAVSNLNETAIGKSNLASFGLSQSQSGLLVKKGSVHNKTLDVVAGAN